MNRSIAGASAGAMAATACLSRARSGEAISSRAIGFAAAEDQAVLGVELGHGHLGVEIVPGGGENGSKDVGIQEKRGPDIKAKSLGLDRAGPATDRCVLLENMNFHPRRRQQQRRRQPPGASPDDNYLSRHAIPFRSALLTGRVRIPRARKAHHPLTPS